MSNKTCTKCGVVKPLTAFYADLQMADGYDGACKECRKAAARKNYRDNIEHRRKTKRTYAASDRGKDVEARSHRTWAARNPDKRKSHHAVNNAVRGGRLSRSVQCSLCGSTKRVEAHHPDYSRPLEVVWLCRQHHIEADAQRRATEGEATIALL